MQFTKSFMLLAALATGVLARDEGHARRQASPTTPSGAASSASSGPSSDWTSVPSNGVFSTSGFGSSTGASGSGDLYTGNVGSPYGSNIIEVSASDASKYKYVIQFQGQNTQDWQVVIWNKYSSDGKADGFYGKACKTFTLAAGATKYYAVDEDSQGGWAAAPGSIPLNNVGSYASTWGEFDFGSTANNHWSGFDVSAIQAQNAGLPVQGMQICSKYNSNVCSSITSNAASVNNAYTSATAKQGGIGGNLSSGPVRLAVTIDYRG